MNGSDEKPSGTGTTAIERAARAAFDANCKVNDLANSDEIFILEIDEWIAIAKAVIDSSTDTEWPLKARVWTRTSVEPHEKVLEIEGVIDDVHMTCRHTQTMLVADSDVPGLPEMYPEDELPEGLSTYARQIAQRLGVEGLNREAQRLIHKIRTASSLYRDGAVKNILGAHEPISARVKRMTDRGDIAGLATELDHLQSRILAAQEKADPFGMASLVLHCSEEKWDAWPSYAAYMNALTPKG